MRNILRIAAIAAITLSLFGVETSAQINLTYGVNNVIELEEGLDNQRVDFFVNDIAGKDYDTFELWIQIGDGGVVVGGVDTGPSLAGVDLGQAGTIFDGGTRGGGLEASQTPLLWADFIDGVTATEDGIGGTLIFDASGFAVGTTIDIIFEGLNVGGSEFDTNFRNGIDNIPENVAPSSNGSIVIVAARTVPEPASSVVVLALAGIMGMRRRR